MKINDFHERLYLDGFHFTPGQIENWEKVIKPKIGPLDSFSIELTSDGPIFTIYFAKEVGQDKYTAKSFLGTGELHHPTQPALIHADGEEYYEKGVRVNKDRTPFQVPIAANPPQQFYLKEHGKPITFNVDGTGTNMADSLQEKPGFSDEQIETVLAKAKEFDKINLTHAHLILETYWKNNGYPFKNHNLSNKFTYHQFIEKAHELSLLFFFTDDSSCVLSRNCYEDLKEIIAVLGVTVEEMKEIQKDIVKKEPNLNTREGRQALRDQLHAKMNEAKEKAYRVFSEDEITQIITVAKVMDKKLGLQSSNLLIKHFLEKETLHALATTEISVEDYSELDMLIRKFCLIPLHFSSTPELLSERSTRDAYNHGFEVIDTLIRTKHQNLVGKLFGSKFTVINQDIKDRVQEAVRKIQEELGIGTGEDYDRVEDRLRELELTAQPKDGFKKYGVIPYKPDIIASSGTYSVVGEKTFFHPEPIEILSDGTMISSDGKLTIKGEKVTFTPNEKEPVNRLRESIFAIEAELDDAAIIRTQFQQDFHDATNRFIATQAALAVKGSILLFLKNLGADSPSLAFFTSFLDSDLGQAIISAILGYMLPEISLDFLKDQPRMQEIARELRIEGYAGGFNTVIDTLKVILLPQLESIFQSLPASEPTRIASQPEEIIEVTESEEEITEEIDPAQIRL